MPSANNTIIIGHLTAAPELRYLSGSNGTQGSAVCGFTVASNRHSNGREDTLFLDITAWGKLAENAARYLTKGSCVFIAGYLKQESWKTQDGSTRTKIKLVADQMQFLSSGAPPAANDKNCEAPRPNQKQGETSPTQQPQQDNLPVSEDDSPF